MPRGPGGGACYHLEANGKRPASRQRTSKGFPWGCAKDEDIDLGDVSSLSMLQNLRPLLEDLKIRWASSGLACARSWQFALAVTAIKYVRDVLVPRSMNWAKGMESWKCPTDPSTSQGACTPKLS